MGNPNKSNDNILLFDAMSLHSVPELHLIAIRIFELCDYVDMIVIMEIMHYPNGQRRNESIWKHRQTHLNMDKMMKLNQCNTSKIIHHEIYKNIFVQGYNIGKRGESLQRVYFDEFRRNKLIDLVYEDCFHYFGDNKCTLNNMNNVYLILSDTDEIPRYPVLKLVRKCNLPYIHVTVQWHAYDFGCHLGKSSAHLVKIFSLKHISADIRVETHARKVPTDYRKAFNLNELTVVNAGGWHLTYFGNVENIIEKNKHKAHLFFHRNTFTNVEYQRCAWQICSYYVHSERSKRVEIVNRTNEYYPLFVQANLSELELKEISPFYNEIINMNTDLYQQWKIYWDGYNHSQAVSKKMTHVDTQTAYCSNQSNTNFTGWM